MSQYWKENSVAISDNDDIVYLQSSVKKHDERIVLRITDCSSKNPKTHYRRTLSLNEAKSLAEMLLDVIEHHKKMDSK